MKIPRFMIAAPKSGSGKTFITCGILELLKRRGLSAASFKCGPDYIDPMFHKSVLGIPSKNLDTFFSDEEMTKSLFARGYENRDISVIEGVMGYFDGMGTGSLKASSYDLACKLNAPVILVVEGRGMSRSIVPMVKGFAEYGDIHNIKGVILNRISPAMFPYMKSWLEEELGIKAAGYMPDAAGTLWESRHLGLVQPHEVKGLKEQVGELADILKDSLDLDELLKIAEEAPDLEASEIQVEAGEKVRVAVAMDEAFSFYYEDNLDLMRRMGAQLTFFSPMRDDIMPEADGVLFGGGYPELHLRELSDNTSMLEDIRRRLGGGMPALAECGGFMYLQEEIEDREGRSHKMAGVLKGRTRMTDKLVRFGYVDISSKEGHPSYLSGRGVIRGHEFHYFDSDENGDSCRAVKPGRKREWDCIAVSKNVMAGFPHLYYYSNPAFIRSFLDRCASFRREKGEEGR